VGTSNIMNIEQARFNMIEQQIKPWKIFDQRLLGAMATIPREKFVPEAHKKLAYADIAIPLGHNQSMLSPKEVARMIQALELKGHEKVLEIGCGSGYISAILSQLANKVYSVDIIADFVKEAKKRLKKLGYTNVSIEEADAADGWLNQAPYDAILITSALHEISDHLKKSLSATGKIVAITGSPNNYQVCTYSKNENNDWQKQALFPAIAKPMINAEQPNQFVF
jgi:protein-L-isoaspartate(D-aspartate) O-methyltransferase